jgi:hypothetical protein
MINMIFKRKLIYVSAINQSDSLSIKLTLSFEIWMKFKNKTSV